MITRSRFGRFLLFFVGILWSYTNRIDKRTILPFADAYRVGDVVDTTMYTKEFPVDLLMANMPLFGLARKVKVPRVSQRFSLAFEEGLHSLPYLDGQMLETLKVTFVYSRSGDGRIHSVTYEPIRSNSGRAINAKVPIDVEFEWIEEEAVNLDAGMSVIFIATLVASIVFLIQLCSVGDNDGGHDDQQYNPKKKETASSSSSVSIGYSSAHKGKYSYE
ncbi:hypothetical protein IV203_023227 [Nitzschia inconspicua]|uniref:Uncharacterized protein n=1 Tax=Nitzschia inconspicua TaxID=303405 RepID=A0A9K3PC23_9STRA|nr:hypothetical protein IV203_023227 [Nitzschia inconspicua]